MTRQCPSCGGICKRSGCERANVEVKSAAGEKTVDPIFPTIHNGSTLPGERGMTLRDLFAVMAMQALLPDVSNPPDEHWKYGVALDAYAMADAMLKAREAK